MQVLENQFTEAQIQVLKATIKYGCWGDADQEYLDGLTKWGFGYMTSYAKEGVINLTNRQIAGVYSGISKTLKMSNIDFMVHIPDYWDNGRTSDGMLFIATEYVDELEEWANN